MRSLLPILLASLSVAQAGGVSSTNYTQQIFSLNSGGQHLASANYSGDGSFENSVGSQVAAEHAIVRNGYIGQLYEVVGFSLLAPTTNLNEGATLQLIAPLRLDDGTVTLGNEFARWNYSTAIANVSPAGLLTAAQVNQDAPGIVTANLEGWSATLNLNILDVILLPGYNQLTSQLLTGGNLRLTFVGSNGVSYALDRTYNLSPPVIWMPQVTNTAAGNGVLVFTNFANTATNNFWRIRSVP